MHLLTVPSGACDSERLSSHVPNVERLQQEMRLIVLTSRTSTDEPKPARYFTSPCLRLCEVSNDIIPPLDPECSEGYQVSFFIERLYTRISRRTLPLSVSDSCNAYVQEAR